MRLISLLSLFRSNTKCYHINTISKEIDVVKSTKETESRESCIKCRYIVALMGFSVLNLLTMHRLNFNVSFVAMVNHSAVKVQEEMPSESCPLPNATHEATYSANSSLEQVDGEFVWMPDIQGYILGSYFVGYLLTHFIGGQLAEIFGFKWIIFLGVFLSSLCNLFTPFAAWLNTGALIAVQVFRGITQGVLQPCLSIMVANWFPKNERGSINAFMFSGQGIGAVIGGYVSGLLCKSPSLGGWPSSFYIFGIVGIILSILIAFLLYENPSVHPYISKSEIIYILSQQENKLSQRRPTTPWRRIFSSVPVFTLTFAVFGQCWAQSQFVTVHPLYLGTILKFPIDKNGLLSSFPFLLVSLCGIIGSTLSAFITKKNYVGINKQRKFWNFLSCLGYTAGVLGISFVECDKTWSIVFSFVSLSFLGFAFVGCLIVPTDLSPTFAGSIMGIACTAGSIANFIVPFVVGFLTNGKQTIEQWKIFFYISIGISMSSAIAFALFGNAEVQPWNFVEEKTSPNDECHKDQNQEKKQNGIMSASQHYKNIKIQE